jgi:peptidoglycan-N-acetylglucosamine deacetylase
MTAHRQNIRRDVTRAFGWLVLAGFAVLSAPSANAAACDTPAALGVARTIEIDATNGPLFGVLTRFPREQTMLRPREVVLTFDDGPMPWVTKSILDTLDRHCTKATFFSVGRMAMAYPETVRSVLARGHTLGTHTWSHPLNLKRLKPDASIAEIDRGFAAVSAAAGQPIAPFFRFPGLSDSGTMLSHLQRRHVATFTVDVVSNDSFIADPNRLIRETLAKIEAHQGGIVLFHDIKVSTAKALPTILSELKSRGFRVVHLTSKHAYEPDPALAAEFGAKLAHVPAGSKRRMMPFYGTTGPEAVPVADQVRSQMAALGATDQPAGEITALAPEGKSFLDQASKADRTSRGDQARGDQKSPRRSSTAISDGWSTVVKRQDARRTP